MSAYGHAWAVCAAVRPMQGSVSHVPEEHEFSTSGFWAGQTAMGTEEWQSGLPP